MRALRVQLPAAAAVLTCIAIGVLAAGASAEDGVPDRGEYRSLVEPICEANTRANKRILRNVRKKARSKRPAVVGQAGRQFIHASIAFGKTVGKIARVPRPTEDDARLRKWFKYLRIVRTNLRHLGKALKGNNKILAAHEAIRVERSSNAANNVSFVFEFRYCRLTQSRFS